MNTVIIMMLMVNNQYDFKINLSTSYNQNVDVMFLAKRQGVFYSDCYRSTQFFI